ncbi:MAG: TRZ/ATZ family hydrolase [Pseudomonadales bacterium]|nr:TRZ/ATZ family hydrolase [Pseudomonadales bacterium]
MNSEQTTRTQIDSIIYADWIIPVIPRNTILEDHAVAIDKGEIRAILPSEQIELQFEANKIWHLKQQVLLPGLINGHGHAAMSLFRGMADDLPLQNWLNDQIWPAEQQWVSAEFVHDGSELAIAEMLLSGTTFCSDMYFFPDMFAEIAHQMGIRSQVCFPVMDFPTIWAQNADEYISKGLQLQDDYRDSETVNIAFGPHAPYTVSDAPMQRIAMLSAELEIPVHTHLHETRQEIQDSLKQYGKRPIKRLADLGLLSPSLQAVHATHLNEEDIRLLKKSNAHVIHCPESNMKLASGYCPIISLLEAGVNVGLGTDGCASNNDLDLFSEMRSAALTAKANSGNAATITDHDAIEMATINGARAIGLEHKLGSIEAGKWADLIAINLDSVFQQPIYNPLSQLIYTNSASQLSHSWIGGKAVVEQSQLIGTDTTEIIHKAKQWRNKITNRASLD